MQSVTMTSQKQTSLFTEEQLTSSQEDSPASHIQQQESDSEKKMSAICGQKCLEQFEKFNHVGLWAKTFSALLIGMEGWYSKRCKLIWKLKGTKSNRMYFQLRPLTLHTEETEFGLWPTPRAQEPGMTSEGYGACLNDVIHGRKMNYLLPTPSQMEDRSTPEAWDRRAERKKQEGINLQLGLCTMARKGMRPTPNAQDWNTGTKPETYQARKERHAEKGVNLQMSLRQMAMGSAMLPTPAMSNYKGASSTEALEERGRLKPMADNFADQFAVSGKSSQLSPQFVLEMMGFPTDWTLLPFLSGETNPSKQEETQ